MAVNDINQMTRPVSSAVVDFINDKEAMIRAFSEAKASKSNRVSDMDRMEMLQASMRDDENQRMRSPDIVSVALQIARSQGDTSEDNINLIIRQLQSLVPSVTQTTEKETTPTMSQGIQGLLEKLGVMTGQQSDPMVNRSVGFGRVR
jgi:uncharacterized protein with PIN domain